MTVTLIPLGVARECLPTGSVLSCVAPASGRLGAAAFLVPLPDRRGRIGECVCHACLLSGSSCDPGHKAGPGWNGACRFNDPTTPVAQRPGTELKVRANRCGWAKRSKYLRFFPAATPVVFHGVHVRFVGTGGHGGVGGSSVRLFCFTDEREILPCATRRTSRNCGGDATPCSASSRRSATCAPARSSRCAASAASRRATAPARAIPATPAGRSCAGSAARR